MLEGAVKVTMHDVPECVTDTPVVDVRVWLQYESEAASVSADAGKGALTLVKIGKISAIDRNR